MGQLTDVAITAWIRSGKRFEARSDGDGLVLTWREERTAPSWRPRRRFADAPRVMEIGSYPDLTLAAAHQAGKALRARIAPGHDLAGEKSVAPGRVIRKSPTNPVLASRRSTGQHLT